MCWGQGRDAGGDLGIAEARQMECRSSPVRFTEVALVSRLAVDAGDDVADPDVRRDVEADPLGRRQGLYAGGDVGVVEGVEQIGGVRPVAGGDGCLEVQIEQGTSDPVVVGCTRRSHRGSLRWGQGCCAGGDLGVGESREVHRSGGPVGLSYITLIGGFRVCRGDDGRDSRRGSDVQADPLRAAQPVHPGGDVGVVEGVEQIGGVRPVTGGNRRFEVEVEQRPTDPVIPFLAGGSHRGPLGW